MALKLLAGETGAGKTTYAVENELLPHFRDGGILVTTVTLNRQRWVEEFGEDAVAARLIELPQLLNEGTPDARFAFGAWEDFEKFLEHRDEKGRGPMFAIDEAHKPIPAGMRFPVDKKTGQRDMTAFPNRLELLCTDQRHHLINIVLITQNPFRIAAPILQQMHSTIYLENAEEKGGKGSFTAKIWSGPPPRNYKTAKFAECNDAISKPKKYNKDTWAYFVSNTKVKDGASGRELEGKYRNARSIWKRPYVMFGIPAGIAFVLYQGFSLYDQAANPTGKKPDAAAKAFSSTSPTSPPPPKVVQAEYKPEQVIPDLAVEETISSGTEAQRKEAAYVTYLHTSYGSLGTRTGPVVVTQYPEQPKPYYALLTDYASFWGYSITPAHCGWRLTRKDHSRELVDANCLSRSLYATAASSDAPAASPIDGSPLGPAQPANAGVADPRSVGRRT